MQALKNIIIIVALQMSLPIYAQNILPYVVYNATKGVILKSTSRGEEFYPVRGTQLYEKDTFLLKDNRYVVKIKDKRSGEIFTWDKGEGAITPLQIVSLQRYDGANKLFSFFLSLAEEMGFETKPVRTSQGVIKKGRAEETQDSLSVKTAYQIKNAISDSIYVSDVFVNKVYSQDSTFFYSIQNRDTINYAMVLYTVTKEGVFRHDDIIVYELGRPRPDEIEFLRLIPNYTFNFDYFSFSAADGENDRTCYVLLFNPSDFYIKKENDKYESLIDWDVVSKELTYQGDICKVIYLRK